MTTSTSNAKLEKAFLDSQRARLLDLRATLSGTRKGAQAEQVAVNDEATGEARGFEDDAQKLVTLELEGNLEARDTTRLATVERALRKLDEGTYGLSDSSGEAIPRERLEAVPEAVHTLAEQSELDEKG